MDNNILNHGLLDIFKNQQDNVTKFASSFADVYERFALTATPTPIVTGHRDSMVSAISGGMAGSMDVNSAVSAIVNGVTVYWQGVVLIGGGVVVGFLGGSLLSASLYRFFSNIKSSQDAADQLTDAVSSATKQVQYVILPNPPAFLV